MSGLDFYVVGEVRDFGSHVFSKDEIKAFNRDYGPHPCHFESWRSAKRNPRAIYASGWHVGCIWMAKISAYREREFSRYAARTGHRVELGPSPGLENMRWVRPVLAGETIHFGSRVSGSRLLNSKPGWAMVSCFNFAKDEHGQPVMMFDSFVLVKA